MPRTKSTKPLDRVLAAAARAEDYQRHADRMSPANEPERITQKWMAGMAHHFRRQFGERLRALREKAGLTMRDLEEAAGIAPGQVSRMESGERACSFQTAIQVAAALGVKLDILAPEPETR